MMFDGRTTTIHLSKALLPLAAGLCLAGQLFAQTPPSPTTEAKSAPGNIRDYQEQVAFLASQHNAYNAELAEAMVGLGLAYQQEGNHEEAITTLNQALQIQRINHGLYHIGKIPLIEKLLVSYAALGDWDEVDEHYYTMTQLYARNYDNYDAALLPGQAKLINWHLYAYRAKVTENPLEHLYLARNLISQSIGIIRFNYGVDDLRQLEPFATLVLTDYFLAAASQEENQQNLSMADYNSFRNESILPNSQFMNRSQTIFSQGKRHIQDMIRITQTNPETPPRMAVDTLLLLADWHMTFKQSTSADLLYRQVWEQAVKLDDHELYIEETFVKPVVLPKISISGTSFAPDGEDTAEQGLAGSSPDLAVLVFEFDITTTGRARDPELVESDSGATKDMVNKSRRRLKSSRFRPRYDDGMAVENLDARIRYRYKLQPERSLAEAGNAE